MVWGVDEFGKALALEKAIEGRPRVLIGHVVNFQAYLIVELIDFDIHPQILLDFQNRRNNLLTKFA